MVSFLTVACGLQSEYVEMVSAARFIAEAQSGACVDVNLADMVLPLLSLAPSPSRVRVREITPHLKSGMEIARLFTSCGWSADADAGSSVVTVTPGPRSGTLARHNV